MDKPQGEPTSAVRQYIAPAGAAAGLCGRFDLCDHRHGGRRLVRQVLPSMTTNEQHFLLKSLAAPACRVLAEYLHRWVVGAWLWGLHARTKPEQRKNWFANAIKGFGAQATRPA